MTSSGRRSEQWNVEDNSEQPATLVTIPPRLPSIPIGQIGEQRTDNLPGAFREHQAVVGPFLFCAGTCGSLPASGTQVTREGC